MYKWVRGVLELQKTPQNDPQVIRMGSKVDKSDCEDPLRAQVVYNAALGRDYAF